MNWYKKIASPALHEHNRGREISDYSENLKSNNRIKLFNYIKSQNITGTFYHGTTLKRYNMAKKNGYLLSGNVIKNPNPITPSTDTKFVFFTPNKSYAQVAYADIDSLVERSMKELDRKFKANIDDVDNLKLQLNEVINNVQKYDDKGVVLTLQIPIYAITEVKDAILGGMEERQIGSNLDIQNLDKYKNSPNKIIPKILSELQNSHILTTYLALPLKWVTSMEYTTDSLVDFLIATLDKRQALAQNNWDQKGLDEFLIKPELSKYSRYPHATGFF